MGNPDVAAMSTGRNCGSRRVVIILVPFFMFFNALVFFMFPSKRACADQLTTEVVVHVTKPNKTVDASKPKEVPDAIQPSFAEFQDFRAGPRNQVYAAGSTMKDLELKHKRAGGKTTDPLYAGMCKFEGDSKTASLYAAAWLSSKETILKVEKFTRQYMQEEQEDFVNQELGFFAAVEGDAQIAYSSVDMFDFFVHHLSGYDFSIRYDENWDPEMLRLLQGMIEGYRKKGYNNPSRVRNGNVLAILPFHSGASTGRSINGISKAHMFLQATIITVAAVFPNIAVFVASPEDYNWLVYESGLNRFLYDVQLISWMRNPSHLCVATSVVAKEKLLDGSYDASFEWIYYTESDQLPHLRNVDNLLELAMQENTLVIPHRGECLWHPQDVALQSVEPPGDLANPILEKELLLVDDIMSASCCFDQRCLDVTQDTFTPFNKSSVKLFQQHESFVHIAGTGNNFEAIYRTCKLSTHRRHNCIEDN
jgi:hypothetical protein